MDLCPAFDCREKWTLLQADALLRVDVSAGCYYRAAGPAFQTRSDPIPGVALLRLAHLFLVSVAAMGQFCFCFFKKFIWLHPDLSCSMWDLVPWPRIEPMLPALGVWSLNHWTTRKSPVLLLLFASPSGLKEVCDNAALLWEIPLGK